MKNLSLLIKPVSSKCNIACLYCFYKDEDKLRESGCFEKMSFDTLELLVKRSFEDVSEEVSYVFQGGEPTLCGLAFYEKFIEFTKLYNKNNAKINLNLQTNGLLLDDSWAKFLKKHNFLVGISIDGPSEINDINRVDYNGKGTTFRTLKAIELLKRYDVDFNCLMVVSKANAYKAKECYSFFKTIGVKYLQIIPALDPFGPRKDDNEKNFTSEELYIFLKSLFDVWAKDFLENKEIRITYFENIIVKLMNQKVSLCSMNAMCMIENIVETNGNVYPCDFYCGDDYLLGNIADKSFKEIIFSLKAQEFITQSVAINTHCNGCRYKGICLGGCKRYQIEDLGKYKNYYCDAYKRFFDYSYTFFQKIANLYKESNII